MIWSHICSDNRFKFAAKLHRTDSRGPGKVKFSSTTLPFYQNAHPEAIEAQRTIYRILIFLFLYFFISLSHSCSTVNTDFELRALQDRAFNLKKKEDVLGRVTRSAMK